MRLVLGKYVSDSWGTRIMTESRTYPTRMIYWILMAGVAVRAFAAIYTCVINPDGMIYIQQAKAIYHGDWQLLKSCFPFVSSYPFLIAAAYWVFPSWIGSARLVSVFFGSLTLVPLYFLLRRFTDERTACLSVLLYAFMPVLVGGSADLVRDPICWFFLVSGLYFFVRQLENREPLQRRFFYLVLSYLLFLMTAWARPETFMVLIFSCFYTFLYSLFSKQKRYVLVSVSSLLLFGLLLIAGAMIFDPSFNHYSSAASAKLSASFDAYRNLRQQLGAVAEDLDQGVLRSFLSKTRSLVWLINLGLLVSNSIAGIFYPYVVFFVFGFIGLTARLRKDPRVVCLLILVILGYGLLFVHVLQFWYFEHRFLHIILLSGSILAAFGIEQIVRFVHDKIRWQSSVTVVLICLYILAFGLGKNIKKREEDKVVFRHLAVFISELEKPNHGFVPVLTGNSSSLKLVPFYVNLHLSTGFCPVYSIPAIRNNEELFGYTKEKNVKYFLWDAKNWSKTGINIHRDDFRQKFKRLKQWEDKKFGEIILFYCE